MNKLIAFTTLFGVAVLLASSANAEQISIANASFEDPSFAGVGNNWSDANPDWGDDAGASGDEFIELTMDAFTSEVTGQHLQNHVGIQNLSSLQQDLTTNFAANTTYTLEVSVGNRASQTNGDALFEIRDSADNVLAAGSTDSSLIGANTFAEFSTSFSTGGAAPAGPIRLFLGAGTDGARAHFDNIRLDGTLAVIPEPASATVLGLGALGMLISRRRRK